MRTGKLLLVSCMVSILTGCAGIATAPPQPSTGLAINGNVHGGQQPIAGAHVYLFAANTTGYGNASVSLLRSATNTTLDTSGGPTNGDYYVATGADGSFTITSDYSCTANTQVYLYALGGNPGLGSGANSAAGLLAAAGNCPNTGSFLATTPFVIVNEVSTVAAAYAFAGFATDATHVSSSGTALAQVGIQNAFANAGNLANIASGTALATTPSGNGTVPRAEINTLGNILSACINSSGAVSGPTSPTPCYTLFNNALAGGTSGSIPTDTATAAINIAHNPGVNVAALYGLASSSPPFAPALTAKPNDFTIALSFAGGGLEFGNGGNAASTSVAIDSSGNAWIETLANGIAEFSPVGVPLSPSSAGFYGGGSSGGYGIAIDPSGNVWVSNYATNNVSEFTSAGAPLSPSTGFTGGGLSNPYGIAIDGFGDIWAANFAGSVSKLSNAGAALSPSTGFASGGLAGSLGIAVDPSENIWVAFDGAIAKFSNSGTAISPSGGYASGPAFGPYGIAIDSSGNSWATGYFLSDLTELSGSGVAISPSGGYTGGGLGDSRSIAIDGKGNVWVADAIPGGQPGRISEFSSSGTALSPSTGFTGGGMVTPYGIAIDGSGDVWVANYTRSSPRSSSVLQLRSLPLSRSASRTIH